jgi:RNA polymerase sigma-70 factor (ECF subfamily)
VLVRRYQEIAFRTAYLITGQTVEAEDTAQEAFVKAYYALNRFRSGAPFRPWLLQIVANEARNRRKAASRRSSLGLDLARDDLVDNLTPLPETAALAAEERAALFDALKALRPEDRLIIVYRYFFDLSEAEMVGALGCVHGTVKSRLSRALGRLRDVLESRTTKSPGAGRRSSGREEGDDG